MQGGELFLSLSNRSPSDESRERWSANFFQNRERRTDGVRAETAGCPLTGGVARKSWQRLRLVRFGNVS